MYSNRTFQHHVVSVPPCLPPLLMSMPFVSVTPKMSTFAFTSHNSHTIATANCSGTPLPINA
eukprot:10615226-Lingulodinium_polyedra.AAC.1